jgi:phage-related protein
LSRCAIFRPATAEFRLKGFGGAVVLEVVEDHIGDTYRGVYTVKFAGVIYVLHVFQKKSKSGIGTPRQEIRLFRFLNALDCDIEIVVKPKARSAKYAEVRVLAA